MNRLPCLVLLLAACGETQEAKTVNHPIRSDGAGVETVSTDLGYTVTTTRLRTVVRDLRFTRGGETHAGLWPLGWLVGTAHAHPGHSAGGETVGELPGRFVVDWLAPGGTSLGAATMLEGGYDGADFTFALGAAADGLATDDPLLGATFDVAGRAEKAGRAVEFTARLAIEEGTDLVGAPFDADVGDDGVPFVLRLVTRDPGEQGTVYDGVDFFALGEGGAVALPSDSAQVNRLRRNLRVHDHYLVTEE